MSLTDPASGGEFSPAVPRETSQVLLPAEPSVFMSPEQLDIFSRSLQRPAERAVAIVDTLPIANDQKHQIVKSALMTFGASQLQHSVKELRGVPTETLALGLDLLITTVVGLIRGGVR